jgi:hypothetical protein
MTLLERVRAAVADLLARLGLNGSEAVIGVVLFLVSFFGSIALTGAVLVRLPPDFLTNESPVLPARKRLRAHLLRLLRHVIGILLILIGLVLSIPGVPGQGILTIIAGLFISELPGTNRLLRRVLRSPKIFAAVNKLRARYKHPPLAPAEAPAV